MRVGRKAINSTITLACLQNNPVSPRTESLWDMGLSTLNQGKSQMNG